MSAQDLQWKEFVRNYVAKKYMGARRYEISLRVFNSIAHEWGFELNSRREISYLKVTMYYFLSYKQNNYWLIENGEGFAVHSSTWPSGAKGELRVSSWLAIPNTGEKNNDTCSHLMWRLFSGLKFLHNTIVYIMVKDAFQEVQ